MATNEQTAAGPADDVIDLRDVARRVRRHAVWIVAGCVLGLSLGAAAAMMLPKRYQGVAKVLVREPETGGMGLNAPSEGGLGLLLGGAAGSGLDTEIEILTSRPVLEEVVDSLHLQAELVRPRGRRFSEFFSNASFDRADHKGGVYRFTREGGAYRVEDEKDGRWTATPGQPLRLPHAVLTLRARRLPDEFHVTVVSRRAAVDAARKALAADATTSDVAELVYHSIDPERAAAVPNALMDRFLVARTSSDRNVNRHRYEFLVRQEDSIRTELAQAESTLQAYQEQTGTFDAGMVGSTSFERAMELQAAAEQLEVELRSLSRLVDGVEKVDTRDLAAFPTFLKNEAINDLLRRLLESRARRTDLLESRTERDPDVVSLNANIAALEDELRGLSLSYRNGLRQQQQETRQALAPYQSLLATIPSQLQQQSSLQRETRRLTETLLGIQGQLVTARMAAIGEGGEVRPIETAIPPERPVSPRVLLLLAGGLVLGMVGGTVGALVRGYTDPVLRTAGEAERELRMQAVELPGDQPLLLGGLGGARTMVLVPVDDADDAVRAAGALVEGTRLQGRDAVLLDLTGASAATAAGRLAEAAALHPVVVVAAPGLQGGAALPLLAGGHAVVLVARAGRTRRAELGRAAALLRRLDVAPAAVVVVTGPAVLRKAARVPAVAVARA